MVGSPVVLGYPANVICTGAGLRAKAGKRLSAMCSVKSARISILS